MYTENKESLTSLISSVSVFTVVGVSALLLVKAGIHYFGLEIFTLNALFTSAIGGVVFIIGFLLSGIIADYKEADKFPVEFRSTLESIYEKALVFKQKNSTFDLESTRQVLQRITEDFISGVSHQGGHHDLQPCVDSINALSNQFSQMEALGMPANYIVRLENEQSLLRKHVLRVYHIQRTMFLPSAHTLATTLIFGVIGLLLFLKTEGSIESAFLLGFISYLFMYIYRLIQVIEKPFRGGHTTMDDVSLFILREFQKRLSTDQRIYTHNN